MPGRSLSPSLVAGLLFSLVLLSLSFRTAWAENDVVVTPSGGIENGGLAVGANLRYFFLPNLAGEIDGAYGTSLCQDCRLSEATLTANLVYEIRPLERLSLFLVAGGGAGFLALNSPESLRSTLSLFDIGVGASLGLVRTFSLTLEDRWFVPLSGGLPGVGGGSPALDRIFLGLSTAF